MTPTWHPYCPFCWGTRACRRMDVWFRRLIRRPDYWAWSVNVQTGAKGPKVAGYRDGGTTIPVPKEWGHAIVRVVYQYRNPRKRSPWGPGKGKP